MQCICCAIVGLARFLAISVETVTAKFFANSSWERDKLKKLKFVTNKKGAITDLQHTTYESSNNFLRIHMAEDGNTHVGVLSAFSGQERSRLGFEQREVIRRFTSSCRRHRGFVLFEQEGLYLDSV